MILFCFIDRYNYDNNGTEKTSRHSLPKNKKKMLIFIILISQSVH